MRIINQMPFNCCERCNKCVLKVKTVVETDGRKLYVGCQNAHRCLKKNEKGENEHED